MRGIIRIRMIPLQVGKSKHGHVFNLDRHRGISQEEFWTEEWLSRDGSSSRSTKKRLLKRAWGGVSALKTVYQQRSELADDFAPSLGGHGVELG
ncbi:hypothetical protein SAMN05421753_108246 [Planctomicrobium piriforme]|uniref:Uncharacterized protein n=1 Tax=Planctomicrobium piriforme TaxID=1576369 RepID=A0A1I3HYX9_9PLAN|nr:hypothetical protein SAMN05421753_108246 [Planctomicrobium piriforme]